MHSLSLCCGLRNKSSPLWTLTKQLPTFLTSSAAATTTSQAHEKKTQKQNWFQLLIEHWSTRRRERSSRDISHHLIENNGEMNVRSILGSMFLHLAFDALSKRTGPARLVAEAVWTAKDSMAWTHTPTTRELSDRNCCGWCCCCCGKENSSCEVWG